MTITAWRIFKRKNRATAFSGIGARRFAGRWNSKGVAVVYLSESPSLAALEMLVHLQAPQLLQDYLLAPVVFDEPLVQVVKPSQLPANWRRDPPPAALRRIGDEWVADERSAVLRVPSAIIETQYNYLVNPAHTDFAKCLIGKARRFRFDPRLK